MMSIKPRDIYPVDLATMLIVPYLKLNVNEENVKGKFETIVFRNFFNNGDLHAIRTFLWYIKSNIHGYQYKLNHPQSTKTLGDLGLPLFWKSNQKYRTFDNRGYHIEYNTLFINTQYLAFNGIHFQKNSATLLTAWNIFNQTLNEVFAVSLPTNYKMFLPKIYYNCGMYNNIKLIDQIIELYKENKKVLICNNNFGSEQAIQFNFDPIIDELARIFPDIMFFVTNITGLYSTNKHLNVLFVPDIIGKCDGCDLNEISYLSTKCDVLIGRNSGPHTFSYVTENLLNPQKKFISFSAPSGLYGSDPEKFIDFGIREWCSKDECAQFFNVIKFTDKERIFEISKIIGE